VARVRPGDVDRSEVLGQTSRILIAPAPRLTDDFVLIRADEMPQKPLASFVVNERSERTTLRTSTSVQLDRKLAVINDALKRWRIPQILLRQIQRYTISATPEMSREKVRANLFPARCCMRNPLKRRAPVAAYSQFSRLGHPKYKLSQHSVTLVPRDSLQRACSKFIV
jgi:hypothetical protein